MSHLRLRPFYACNRSSRRLYCHLAMNGYGDLNNVYAARATVQLAVDPAYSRRTFAIGAHEDDPAIRESYRPFLLPDDCVANDWIADLELSAVLKLVESEILLRTQDRLRILVLYGSLRSRSYSRLLAYEAARILFRLGCDVRVYDPTGLPQKDDLQHSHSKVQELRELSKWSDGQVWVSPEQHGNITGIFKQQIDWIPLSTGSVRPTQGRTLAVAQVNGGSQSFNSVNSLRILGRWMRMFAIPNQSSVPKAYTQFTTESEGSRMIPSGNRDRLVDCMEELVKYTIVMRQHFDLFGDRFSEREERRLKDEKMQEEEKAAKLQPVTNGV
ncbi:NADPH-dependent FMN reductase ArsH [Copromyces sp. CBS 386.78]|nr:NADPH-dependent FMN reductase ArsH [Copromyces sp. CBS 386.78]